MPKEDTQFKEGNQEGKKSSRKGIPNTKTILEKLLDDTNVEVTDSNGTKLTVSRRQALLLEQIKKGLKGDSVAFTKVFDRLDGKPTQTNVIEDKSNVINITRCKEDNETEGNTDT